jgi:hypothetical protein
MVKKEMATPTTAALRLVGFGFAAFTLILASQSSAMPTSCWEARGLTSLAPPSATAGLLIAIDPETGRVTAPTVEQRRALRAGFGAAEAPGKPDEFLPVERITRGGELAHLEGRFQVFSVARRDASGRIVTDCAADSAAAVQFLLRPAAQGRVER